MKSTWRILQVLLQAGLSYGAYVWPSEHDYLEDVLYLQSGYIRLGFRDAVSPCSFGTNFAGRQNAAEWLRTAYHDMSTHDAAAGTGGVDASIMFELDRAENPGSAFNNTFGFFSGFYTSRSSAADLIAMGVVVATSSCGGPAIPFRAGRIDATEAGPSGVPEPQQDLGTLTARFATAGFNVSEMITMVACGHTLGGVHGEDFPAITGNGTIGQVSRFEGNNGTSYAKFDNVVVTQYLADSGENLLVSGANDTTNSDKRVFGADGNQTMDALSEAAVFQTKCANILERMINAVPSTVTLSDPIEPIDIKPYITLMALNNNGTIDFQGRIRVRVSTDTGRNYQDLSMNLTYTDRSGALSSSSITTKRATYLEGLSSGAFSNTFTWFEFATVLDQSTGISALKVHLTTVSTGQTAVYDNGGQGFPVSDKILYQSSQSCLNTTNNDGNFALTVTAAVRRENLNETISLNLVRTTPRQGVVLDALRTDTIPFGQSTQVLESYSLFTIQTTLPVESWATTFDLVLGSDDGEVRVTSQKTISMGVDCHAF